MGRFSRIDYGDGHFPCIMGIRTLARSHREIMENRPLQLFILSLIALNLHFLSGGSGLNWANIILFAFSFIGAVFAYKYSQKEIKFNLIAQDYVFFLYLAWCLYSVFWTPSQIDTIVQVAYLFALWVGATAASYCNVKEIARFSISAAAVVALLSFVFIGVSPDLAFQPVQSMGIPELRGIFKHQLQLGAFMSMAFGMAVIAMMNGEARTVIGKSRALSMLKVGAIVICMMASLARGYTAAAIIALPVSYALTRPGALRVMSILVILGISTAVYAFPSAVVVAVGDAAGDPTFMGRTIIWEKVVEQIEIGSLMVGHGFASFNLPDFDHIWPRYRPPHAHNFALNVLFETGAIGLFLICLFILTQFVTAIRHAPKAGKMSYALFMVVMTFFASLTDVNLGGKANLLVGMALLLVGAEARAKAPRYRSLSSAMRSAVA